MISNFNRELFRFPLLAAPAAAAGFACIASGMRWLEHRRARALALRMWGFVQTLPRNRLVTTAELERSAGEGSVPNPGRRIVRQGIDLLVAMGALEFVRRSGATHGAGSTELLRRL